MLTSHWDRESASEVLDEYFAKIGGRDGIFKQTETAARGKKRGRPSNGAPAAAAAAAPTKRSRKNAGAHPAESTPPASAKKWSPPAGSWEDLIENIDACQEEDTGKLIVYLVWKNGQKTKHDTSVIYKKCPQKVSFALGGVLLVQLLTVVGYRCCNTTRAMSGLFERKPKTRQRLLSKGFRTEVRWISK